jgi:hypothetical protein
MTMTSDDAPPDGGNAAKPMRQALSEELHRAIADDNGQTAEALRLIVRKLTAKAIDGDIQAIKEIFDRMDGKSAAGATTDEGPRKVTLQWKDPQDWSIMDPDDNFSPFTSDGSASPAS